MGLDMYLYLRKQEYTSKSIFRNQDLDLYPKELKGLESEIINRNFASKVVDTYYQVGYWRKANAIHKWFVENCGEGNDDCRKCYVSLEKLQELKELCEEALNDKDNASDTLPTEEGFFFGTTEYDEWYFKDLEYTVQLIDKLLKFMKTEEADDYEIFYQASW